MKEPALDGETRTLVEVSAALAGEDEAILRSAMAKAALSADPHRVEEILLQSYLFLGFPAALQAFAVWRELSPAPVERAGEVDVVVEDAEDDLRVWKRRGEEICRTVYGDRYSALRRNIRAFHPALERWMITEGYGKVLGRPGVDLAVRELAICALLAVCDAPVQLHSHLRGALNAGASPEEVEEALEIAFGHADPRRRARGAGVWARVSGRGLEGC